ncbi:MAG TPA: hypothetical protein VKU19_08540 [Bryobacteraceae bacterium]|nr:hypothetical protein [Bryobacteraceae bacterium]
MIVKMTAFKLIVLGAGLSCGLTAQNTTADMRIEATNTLLHGGVQLELEPASSAFGALLRINARPGGMIIVSGCGVPARYSVGFSAGMPWSTALDTLTSIFPENYWTFKDGVANLLPKQGVPSVMDVQIERFEWDTAANEPSAIFRIFDANGVKSHLTALGLTPYSGLQAFTWLQKAPKVVNGVPEPRRGQKYKLENVTVLTALNAIAAAYGDEFWLYEERKCGGEKTYRISVR